LPVNRVGLRGRPQRGGGLVAPGPNEPREERRWRHVNTDLMSLARGQVTPGGGNEPQVTGRPAPFADHWRDVAAGFEAMAALLRRCDGEAIAAAGLRNFSGVRTRVVLRHTAAYMSLLDRGLHPRLLADGADWSIEFEILKASATSQEHKPPAWGMWLAEQQALARHDVPLFESTSTTRTLCADGRVVAEEYLARAGYGDALARLSRLSGQDVRLQVECIRLAARGISAGTAPVDAAADWRSDAIAIGDRIRAAAFAGPCGEIEWVGVDAAGKPSRRGLRRVGWDVFSGRCGIALFFAALGRHGGRAEDDAFARRMLAPLADRLRSEGPAALPGAPLGAHGVGGTVYGLVAAARLLDSVALLDAATTIAAAVTPAAIAADRVLDIVGGSAGAVLGLLALFRTSRAPWVLERAVAAGRQLVAHAVPAGGALAAPAASSVDVAHARGVAHGACGVAFALSQLHAETGRDDFRDAALTLYGSGGSVESTPAHRNRSLQHGWCQGIAGVALVRLRASAVLQCADLRDGIEDLLVELTPERTEISRPDHLCCGNAGRIECLRHAADVLDDARWHAAADAVAGQIVRRAAVRGSYAVGPVDDVFCPGQYDGLAGIGYQLLRLRYPDLPSPLLWE
jgi:type 2 lantibiotic biosynthesis protein LanM